MSTVDKASEAVVGKTLHVMEALRRIRFLTYGIPLIGVATRDRYCHNRFLGRMAVGANCPVLELYPGSQ